MKECKAILVNRSLLNTRLTQKEMMTHPTFIEAEIGQGHRMTFIRELLRHLYNTEKEETHKKKNEETRKRERK